jgi:hypothetical protein
MAGYRVSDMPIHMGQVNFHRIGIETTQSSESSPVFGRCYTARRQFLGMRFIRFMLVYKGLSFLLVENLAA